MKKANWTDIARSIRKSWNGVNPVTKVDKMRTKYDRKRDRKIPND